MATIKEDYVSFETAKLLKEKGFNIPCKVWYAQYTSKWGGDPSGDRTYNVIQFDDHNKFEDGYKFLFYAPTLQMALKWLRDIHNLDIIVPPQYDNIKWTYSAIIIKLSIPCTEIRLNNNKDKKEESYEEAIKYCLENLI